MQECAQVNSCNGCKAAQPVWLQEGHLGMCHNLGVAVSQFGQVPSQCGSPHFHNARGICTQQKALLLRLL